MFILIWATLLLSLRGSNTDKGPSASGKEHCDKGFCITLSEGELTAEAGLCVVIPCSFKLSSDFTPKDLVWYKCEASNPRCDNADSIFHSVNKSKIQSGFEGRVSLLEPDMNQKNCSIIINELKVSDSGSYQLRVNGESKGKKPDGFTFTLKATVSVKALKQKPTVMIPTLTEGQQATLTCTAPGLCSGSVPEITWTWRGAGGTESHITGNITALKTENLTAVTQRHISTLTFTPSAEHHNSSIRCKISFTGGITTEETSTLNVNCASGYSQHGFCVSLSEGELTAEAGLCVVIPCSFTPYSGFTPINLVWYKCEASKQRCDNSDMIFHSKNNISKKPQPGFEGRVKLLEPDVSQKNCSIIINDLKVSDSGSYQLRVNGKVNEQNLGYTFTSRVAVSVEALKQKPTVMIPTLTEGQQATLTCTAPGLCSGSVPEITWTWRGAGGTESHITGNITALKTENLTAVTQRHISTLTFTPSAEHHNSSIRCEFSSTGGITTEETSALNVNYVKKIKISGNQSVTEGEILNLTCSVESFPPSLIMWTKLGSNTNLHKGTGSATLVILNVTAGHSGQYVCTAEYMNNTFKENISIIVIYVRKPQITGNTTVKEGDILNLTCSVESFPPALIVWKKLNSNPNHHASYTDLHSDTGSASLVIHNVTAEYSGHYICTTKQNMTVTSFINVTVTYIRKPQIIGNTTIKEGDPLTLTCSVESFPPALIVWKKPSFSTNLHSGTRTDVHTDNGSASLVILNVTAEHSGQYACTTKHLNTTVTSYVNVTVTYKRKPQITGNTTVKEGGVLNLTCSVKSFPPALIVWNKLSFSRKCHHETHTDMHTDTGSASLVIHNVTAEHSGQYNCTATHLDTTVTSCANVTVTYIRKPQIIGNSTVKEGDPLNLTCSVESFPPALIVWNKMSSNPNLHHGMYNDMHNDNGSASLVIHNVTAEHSGEYICTAKHIDTSLTSYVNVTVTYKRKLQITGSTTLKEGDVLNLTCSVESFPPAIIVWKQNFLKGTPTGLQNNTGSASLVTHNVTAEHSGQYFCTAKHLDTNVTAYVDVTVTYISDIQNGSGCMLQSEVLTCVCISEGFPLPTIEWPLLKNHTEYSVLNTVSNHTVKSIVSITVRNHGNTTVECVSNNGNGEAKEELLIQSVSKKDEQSLLLMLEYLKIIIAFLIGVLLSAVVCFLAKRFCRKKQKSSRNLDETLEMTTYQDDPVVYDDQTLSNNKILNSNTGPKEVVYAKIDFSLLKRNGAREAAKRQKSTKTEYAEIKRAVKETPEDDDEDEGEVMESKEEEVMMRLEMKHCEPKKQEREEEPVYSTVNDIMDEI